ncbi:tripartite tricarboxylate transporter substrate binding protein [Cupriavidus necator]|uniref:Bug family tripartite tricarboxylate transporter substrate binding protein n=1 Tax=Cupriavidus necator TaxID=106590 RepID=UPI003ECDED8C
MRRQILGGLALAPFILSARAAQGTWPSRPVRIIVPLPAGGGVDVFVRALSERLSAALGQAVIVDNKPGAGGLLGAKALAQAPRDGLTLGYITTGQVTLEAMGGRLDLLKELRPVARLSYSPFVVVVRADSPHKTLGELIAAVKASPGKLSFGSSGIGSPPQFAVEDLNEQLGSFKAVHVPYKGAIEVANAIIGGEVDFTIGLLGTMAPLIAGGKLRALAVTSHARVAALPNVPTMNEAGVPGFALEPWGGLAVPAGTPDAVVARLNEVLPGILDAPAMKELFARQGAVSAYLGANDFTAQIVRQLEKERAVVKRLGMTAQQ